MITKNEKKRLQMITTDLVTNFNLTTINIS